MVVATEEVSHTPQLYHSEAREDTPQSRLTW